MNEINQNFNIFESIENDNNSINEHNSDNDNNNFNKEEEEEEEFSEESLDSIFIEENIQKYNKENYKLKDIITILMKSNILSNHVICSNCHNLMKLVENKSYVDRCVWRCLKTGNNKHDNKQNICTNTIFDYVKADIRLLYFFYLKILSIIFLLIQYIIIVKNFQEI